MGSSTSQGRKNTRLLIAAAGAVVPVLGLSANSYAATVFWSANGTTQGGGLTGAAAWNTTNAHWGPNGGPWTSPWVNANNDNATFDTVAGTVNINAGTATGSPIVVNTITTSISGYSLGNGNLAGAGNTFAWGTTGGITANHTSGTTTLTAVFTGTFNKNGPGRVEMGNGTNGAAVKYALNGGFISIASTARLGAAPGALVPDYFTFNGGGLANAIVGPVNLGGTRGITILAGGAFFGASGAANDVTIDGPIIGSAGGGLTVTTAGPFYSPYAGGGNWQLSNTGNSWDGATTVGANTTLRLGAAGVIPNGSAVTVSGTFNNQNNVETIGSLAGAGSVTNVGGLTAGGNNTGTTFSGTMAGTGSFTKTGTGTMVLSGAASNPRTGTTFVTGGTLSLQKTVGVGVNAISGDVSIGDGTGTDTLRLVNSDQIADTSDMILNGGTFNVDAESEVLDILDVNAASIINMGAAVTNSILRYSNSSAETWAGPLSIHNWTGNIAFGGGIDQIYFATGFGGLSAGQLSQINFYADAGATLLGGGGARFDETGSGEILPVPEPTGLALLGVGALALGVRRRRD